MRLQDRFNSLRFIEQFCFCDLEFLVIELNYKGLTSVLVSIEFESFLGWEELGLGTPRNAVHVLPNDLGHSVKLTVDIVGVGDARVLVHGPAGPQRSAEQLAVRRTSEGLLDDGLLQPAGLPDGDAPGADARPQGLGARLGRSRQRGDQADERGGGQCTGRRFAIIYTRYSINSGELLTDIFVTYGGPLRSCRRFFFSLHVRTSTTYTFARRVPRAHVKIDVCTSTTFTCALGVKKKSAA